MAQLKSGVLTAREEKENGFLEGTNNHCCQTWVGIQEKLACTSPNSKCGDFHILNFCVRILYFAELSSIFSCLLTFG